MAAQSLCGRWGIVGAIVACLTAAACAELVTEQDESVEVAVISQALGTAPEVDCKPLSANGHEYWFCPRAVSWSAARTKCTARGYDLLRIDDAIENAWVRTNAGQAGPTA